MQEGKEWRHVRRVPRDLTAPSAADPVDDDGRDDVCGVCVEAEADGMLFHQ